MIHRKSFSLALFLLVGGGAAFAQTVTHRWSFNQSAGAAVAGTSFTDSASGSAAIVRGNNATLTGTSLQLPNITTTGNQTSAAISAYLDLPNGIISSKTDLTLEMCATPSSYQSYQRLFDFGRIVQSGDGLGAAGELTGLASAAPGATQASDGITLTLNRNTAGSLNQQRFETRLNGVGAGDTTGLYGLSDTTAATTAGTEYHYVLTFQRGVGNFAATGGRASWYRNGVLITSLDTSFPLSQIEDVNNWLGRSLFTGDRNSHAAYNEVRIYSGAMTLSQITASRAAGPNAAITPVAQADSTTVRRGQKVLIPVLANDSGEFSPSTVEILTPPTDGTASVTTDGKILYTQTAPAAASDSFIYRVGGNSGFSNAATVSVGYTNSLIIPNTQLNVPPDPPSTAISLVPAFPGLSLTEPVCLVTPPGENRRLFVCLKAGSIQVIPDVTAPTPTASTFLTLANVATSSECGVLGLAFHPQYSTNRQFYVFYSVNIGSDLYQRVSRFTTSAGNPNFADASTELVLIEQRDEQTNHNGGDLHFGEDGYLYITVGDEGAQNDAENNSQRIDKDFFSGILRIDVDKKPGNLEPNAHPNPGALVTGKPNVNAVRRYANNLAAYSIPIDNPYVHTDNGGPWTGSYNGSSISAGNRPYVRSEFWATGLRNPWRMAFDRVTGDLWIGDVGGSQREEVNLVEKGQNNLLEKGKNFGWAFREGTIDGPKSGQAPTNFATLYGAEPLHAYNHGTGTTQGDSVTGGFVYHGTRVPALTGKYVYADYESGNIWSLQRNGAAPPTVTRIGGKAGISAFGSDPSNGDILLADVNSHLIHRLVSTTVDSTYPPTLSATGLFADLTDLAPAPGMVPYQVNLPFWSDHAEKSRWMIVPDGVSDFTWSRDGKWTLPNGTIWVKHFDMRMQRENPASLKRIETRLLVKNAGGAYGVSYRWNEAGTEATLVADGGEDFPLAITDNGVPVPQTWRIPSRADCMICHTPQAGHALSFNTRQLNLEQDILGISGNQLTTLHQHGFFTNDPGSPNLLPRHLKPGEEEFSEEARVRSWLAVNCAYCHMAGGTGLGNWDGRAELTLAQTGVILGVAANNNGDPANKLIVPGDPTHSIILNRAAATNGFTRMPPLGSNVIDTVSVDLLTRWIDGELDAQLTYDEWQALELPGHPDGAPGDDPDGDGATNQAEFLAGTLPLDGASQLRPQLTMAEGGMTLGFGLPVNRSFQIRTSTDLENWTPWDIPGNQGLPVKGGLIEITRPLDPPQRFFSVEVRGN